LRTPPGWLRLPAAFANPTGSIAPKQM
jgi:hypothetical protein